MLYYCTILPDRQSQIKFADFFDDKYKLIRGLIKAQREFFEETRTLTKYILFSSWSHL